MLNNSTPAGDRIEAARVASLGAAARIQGDEASAARHFREAMFLAMGAEKSNSRPGSTSLQIEDLRMATVYALECGEAGQARRCVAEALALDPILGSGGEWKDLINVSKWMDPWLIASIRRDSPDAEALDELANRYWKGLYGRCYLLTLNDQKAHDLAQEAWCRVLRRRDHLKPGGNFPAYLAKVATNLWRDWYRAEQRAGLMASSRLESLDHSSSDHEDNLNILDCIGDLKSLSANEQLLLTIDIDNALQHLPPRLREVLVARFIDGESCAEIAQRFGRTEQSVSGWVRQALQVMKLHLEGTGLATATVTIRAGAIGN